MLTINFTGKHFPNRNVSSEKCIYETNNCGVIKHFPNGDHLLECEHHVCDNQHKKCPGFYCVPLRTVCDGKWDCPGGIDEENCARISCPGLYRCNSSAVCIIIISICDAIIDCPVHDDEVVCESGLPNCRSCCNSYNPAYTTDNFLPISCPES